jgi:hypothetical protein
MSVLLPKAYIRGCDWNFRFVPLATNAPQKERPPRGGLSEIRSGGSTAPRALSVACIAAMQEVANEASHKRKFICSALREVVRCRCAQTPLSSHGAACIPSTSTAQTRALTGAVFFNKKLRRPKRRKDGRLYDVTPLSVVGPIATKLLQRSEGRDVPIGDIARLVEMQEGAN